MSDMKSSVDEEHGDTGSIRGSGVGVFERKLFWKGALGCDGRRGDEDIEGEDSNSVTVDRVGDAVEWRRNLFFISSMASAVATGLHEVRRGLPSTEGDITSSGSSCSGLLSRSIRRIGLGLPSRQLGRVCDGPNGLEYRGW